MYCIHSPDPNRIVLNKSPRRSKQHNATVGGVIHKVISDDTILAAETNAIRPLAECIGPAWPDVIILYSDVIALEASLHDVKARPTARVERTNVFNQLSRVGPAHFDVSTTVQGWRAIACAIDLRAGLRRCDCTLSS